MPGHEGACCRTVCRTVDASIHARHASQVHFIFRHKNPVTGEFEEKHLKLPPKPAIGKQTNLYTLHVL